MIQAPGPRAQAPRPRSMLRVQDPGSEAKIRDQIQDPRPDPGSESRFQIPDSRFQMSGFSALRCHFVNVRSEILAKPFWGEKGPSSIQSIG